MEEKFVYANAIILCFALVSYLYFYPTNVSPLRDTEKSANNKVYVVREKYAERIWTALDTVKYYIDESQHSGKVNIVGITSLAEDLEERDVKDIYDYAYYDITRNSMDRDACFLNITGEYAKFPILAGKVLSDFSKMCVKKECKQKVLFIEGLMNMDVIIEHSTLFDGVVKAKDSSNFAKAEGYTIIWLFTSKIQFDNFNSDKVPDRLRQRFILL